MLEREVERDHPPAQDADQVPLRDAQLVKQLEEALPVGEGDVLAGRLAEAAHVAAYEGGAQRGVPSNHSPPSGTKQESLARTEAILYESASVRVDRRIAIEPFRTVRVVVAVGDNRRLASGEADGRSELERLHPNRSARFAVARMVVEAAVALNVQIGRNSKRKSTPTREGVRAIIGSMNAKPVNVTAALASFDDVYSPRIIARISDYDVRIAHTRGEHVWHFPTCQHTGSGQRPGQPGVPHRDRRVRCNLRNVRENGTGLS